MARWAMLVGALAVALALGVWALQTPTPRGADAPPVDFAAARAMPDVRLIAQRPHPVGSADHARVQAALLARMQALGLQTSTQTGALSPESIARLRRGAPEGAAPPATTATNLIGVLPGTEPAAPAVLLMAHYDSVPGSPGAADDASGVAAILEAVRAIQARGPARRPLIVLLTDAEELGLDGARIFFEQHPLRDRIGAVVNLEARGGGGRAMMFETGPGNRQTIDLFSRASSKATGGATSNSLAVLVYERMPNGTDFTVARARGIAGVNLAFIGRPGQYHSSSATLDALDQGSLQHIGSQALETADALLRAPALPVATKPRVYADILGRVILGHAPGVGWLLVVAALALAGFAGWRARKTAGLTIAEVGRGALTGVWALAAALVLTHAVRLLAGPLSSRAASAEAYYTLLARLPWIEAGAALTVLAVGLAALLGAERIGRRVSATVVAVAAVFVIVLGGFNPVVLGAGVVAIALSLWPQATPRSTWGAWLGLIALILSLGVAAQAAAPTAAFLLIWPGLLAACVAALAAWLDPGLTRPASWIPAGVATALVGAWIVYLAHPVFLGIGMDLPGVLAPLMLLTLMVARPLAAEAGRRRASLAAVGVCLALALACAVSLGAHLITPR